MAPFSVLHIVEDMKIGGLEKVLASIVLGLDKSNYQPEVWCLSEGGEMADALMNQGIKVEILNLQTYYNPLNIARLAVLMKKRRFHILHAHGYYASTFGRLSALLAGVPIILTHVHSTYFNYSKRNLRVEKFLSHFTDKVICVSKAVQSFVIGTEKIREGKTCVIYNGVDLPFSDPAADEFLRIRSNLGIGHHEIVLIVVASLKPLKGHLFLFNALHDVSKNFQDFRLLVVGDGPQREELESRAEKLGIASRISFTGVREDVPKLLRISDIFILPSVEREGLSMAVIEAMASGLPVVSTFVGGISEEVENNTSGLLVAPNDDKALADALNTLIMDKNLRKRMGEKGREIYVRAFTHRKMMSDIEALYGNLLSQKDLCPTDR